MITHKQLTLAEVFEDCQNKFNNDKYQFLSLLDEAINLDDSYDSYKAAYGSMPTHAASAFTPIQGIHLTYRSHIRGSQWLSFSPCLYLTRYTLLLQEHHPAPD